MADTAPAKKVTLVSSDGDRFELDEKNAMRSVTIRNMIEDDCADSPIPLPNVTTKVLVKVLEYLNKHGESKKQSNSGESSTEPKSDKSAEELKAWDADFINVDHGFLFDIILAANYMDIKDLLDLTCQGVADRMKSKSVVEIREMFGITNDYTPEEEAEVVKENQWAFD